MGNPLTVTSYTSIASKKTSFIAALCSTPLERTVLSALQGSSDL